MAKKTLTTSYLAKLSVANHDGGTQQIDDRFAAYETENQMFLAAAAAAVAWTYKNIAKYNGSRRMIFVAGHSAGGYLLDIIGLDKRWPSALPDVSVSTLFHRAG